MYFTINMKTFEIKTFCMAGLLQEKQKKISRKV